MPVFKSPKNRARNSHRGDDGLVFVLLSMIVCGGALLAIVLSISVDPNTCRAAALTNKGNEMVELTESEEKDLLAHYVSFEIDEQETVQPDWVSRKFPSTGRVCRCVESDGSVVIKQVYKNVPEM